MNDLLTYYGIILLTFLVAGTVKGVTGMGLPTVAMGLLGMVMSPSMAAAILVIPSFITNVWQFVSGPTTKPTLQRLAPMLVAIIVGTVAGSALLVKVNPTWSGFALGLALIIYAVFTLFAPNLSVPKRIEPWLSPVIGILTGIVTGATGVFVMPAVPYIGSLGLKKDELVQALGLSFTVSTIALAIGLWLNGAFAMSQLGVSTLSIVPSLIGMFIGQMIRARISPQRFKQCFLIFLIVLGADLASRPFFA